MLGNFLRTHTPFSHFRCITLTFVHCFAENPLAKRKRSATADVAPVLTLVPFEGDEIATKDVGVDRTAVAGSEAHHGPSAKSDDHNDEPQNATDESPRDGEPPRSQRRRCDSPSPRCIGDVNDFEDTDFDDGVDFLLS